MRSINKSRMRHPPRNLLLHRIKTLDQRNLARRLRILEKPFMTFVRLHRERLPPSIRIYQRGTDKVFVGHGMGRGDCEWIFVNRLDGTPDIYDLEAVFEEFWGFVGEVVRDAGDGGGVGLVYVDSPDRAAKLDTRGALVLRLTTDGVVEDEDAVGSCSVVYIVRAMWFEKR